MNNDNSNVASFIDAAQPVASKMEPPLPLAREMEKPEPFPVECLGEYGEAMTLAIHDQIQASIPICA